MPIHKYQYQKVTTEYLEEGQGQNLLFLHGGGLNFRASSYQEILMELSQNYHVIAPDIPCFGAAVVPEECWSFYDYAVFFDNFLKDLNLENVIVVGHSFGGGIALLTASFSERITKLIIIDSTGLPFSNFTFLHLILSLVNKTLKSMTHGQRKKALLLVIESLQNFIKHFLNLPKIYLIVKKCLTTDYLQIKEIKIPTLILWGKYDALINCSKGEKLSQLIPNSKLEIIEGGHDWCLFNSKLLVQKIRKFT